MNPTTPTKAAPAAVLMIAMFLMGAANGQPPTTVIRPAPSGGFIPVAPPPPPPVVEVVPKTAPAKELAPEDKEKMALVSQPVFLRQQQEALMKNAFLYSKLPDAKMPEGWSARRKEIGDRLVATAGKRIPLTFKEEVALVKVYTEALDSSRKSSTKWADQGLVLTHGNAPAMVRQSLNVIYKGQEAALDKMVNGFDGMPKALTTLGEWQLLVVYGKAADALLAVIPGPVVDEVREPMAKVPAKEPAPKAAVAPTLEVKLNRNQQENLLKLAERWAAMPGFNAPKEFADGMRQLRADFNAPPKEVPAWKLERAVLGVYVTTFENAKSLPGWKNGGNVLIAGRSPGNFEAFLKSAYPDNIKEVTDDIAKCAPGGRYTPEGEVQLLKMYIDTTYKLEPAPQK